jgi:hypothetical protein
LLDHFGAIFGVLAAATLVVDVDTNLHRDELQRLDADARQAASVLYSTFHAVETVCDHIAEPGQDHYMPSKEFCGWATAQSYRFYELQFDPDYIRIGIGPPTIESMTLRPLRDVIEYRFPQSDPEYRDKLLNELDAMDKLYCSKRSPLFPCRPIPGTLGSAIVGFKIAQTMDDISRSYSLPIRPLVALLGAVVPRGKELLEQERVDISWPNKRWLVLLLLSFAAGARLSLTTRELMDGGSETSRPDAKLQSLSGYVSRLDALPVPIAPRLGRSDTSLSAAVALTAAGLLLAAVYRRRTHKPKP